MFKVYVKYPSFEEEFEVARRTTSLQIDNIETVLTASEILELQRIVREVPVSDHIIRYALAGAPDAGPRARRAGFRRRSARLGAGPRAVQFLILGAKAKRSCTTARMSPAKTSNRWPNLCYGTGWC